MNTLKYESIRLREKYPNIVFPINNMESIFQKQFEFDEEEKNLLNTNEINLDMRLFEPLPEPILTDEEDRALSLRVQCFEDDEIADAMDCSIKHIKNIFKAIEEKYHQPKIPQHVYLSKRKIMFPELFS